MKTSDKGLVALMAHEGIVIAPYKDSRGVWTFGVGHTAAAGAPDPAQMTRGPVPADGAQESLLQALRLFSKDVAKYEKDVRKAFRRPITQEQFDAAVSFHYNTGGILRATWVKLFNDGNLRDARKAFLNWRKPPEIMPRRKAEKDLFFDAIYPRGNVPIYNADANGRAFRIGSQPPSEIRRKLVATTMPVHGNSMPLDENSPAVHPYPVEVPRPVGEGQPVSRPDHATGDGKRGGLAVIIAGAAAAVAAWAAGFFCSVPWLGALVCGG